MNDHGLEQPVHFPTKEKKKKKKTFLELWELSFPL